MIETLASLAFFIVALHYGTKLLDWIRIERKFKSNKSEFIADCYKLIQKYSKRGEHDFCIGLQKVITAFNEPEISREPQTEEGRGYIKNIVEEITNEVREKIKEDYVE